MNLINWWSSVGLILDIIGVLMLFEYGLPSKLRERGGSLSLEESSEDEKERILHNKKIVCRSYIGLSLIILGFILQLIGTNLSLFY